MSSFFAFLFGDFCREMKMGEKERFREGEDLVGFKFNAINIREKVKTNDEGRGKIHLAGERGCLLAKYVDGMMNLAFSVDHRGLVHNYPGFTREYVDRMLGTLWPLGLR